MQIKNICRQAEKSDYIILMSMLLCIILTGGFYWYSCIIPCILLLIYILLRRSCFLTWHSIILLTMMVFSFISVTLSKGDKQNAFYEFEKLLCLILSIYAGSKCQNKNVIKDFFVFAAFFISTAGLVAYCNIIKNTDFVLFDRGITRLQSFIQYSNTTSVLLACGYFFTLDTAKNNNVTIFISQCILSALYLTVSKGGIILYILTGIALIIFDKKSRRLFILQNVLNLIFSATIIAAVSKHFYSLSLILIAANIIIGCYVLKLKISSKVLAALIICCLIGGLALIIIFIAATDINIFTTFGKRIDYMRDACKLIKGHYLFGIGPGAWKYYQFLIQTQQYNVRYIHNGWLQFLVENGIIFVLLFFTIIISSIKNLLKNKNYCFIACITLMILHSLMDFDLSFGAALMFFGIMLGMGVTLQERNYIFKITNTIVIIISILIITYMSGEYFVRHRFETNCINKRYDEALNTAHILEQMCPYDSNLQISIAALDENNAEEHIKKARDLSPLDADILKQYINYYIDTENIFELIKEYIELCPKQETTYTDAYEFLNRIWEQKKCSREEYIAMSEYIERRQHDEQVINRNQLLYDN